VTPQQAYEFTLLLIAIWREARGEPLIAKLGVGWVIRNRVLHPSWWGASWPGVILQPFQFSSFNHNDPNATKIPLDSDPAFEDCLNAAGGAYFDKSNDPTGGATSYYSTDIAPPSWTKEMTFTVQLGALRFYR